MTSRYIPTRTRTWFRTVGWLALALVLQQPLAVLAQTAETEYRLRAGDEIMVGVPGRPELEQSLALDAAGRVTVPQVGEVVLGGLTIAEAGEVLRQRLRLFYPSLDEVEVELKTTSQIRFYVIGEVRTSGEYQFTVQPTIWDLLRSAGGPTDGADLARARVVRIVDGKTVVVPIDLSDVIESGGVEEVALQTGDTLVVPARRDETISVAAHDGVQVFGAVGQPTVVEIDEPTELVQVLMLAGAPTTTSNLKKVYWVHRLQNGFQAEEVNVRKFLEDGDPTSNPLVHPGDTLEVRDSTPSWFSRSLPLILGVIATTATVALAYDRIVND
jgi:polysaccharide export outer membrane protein